MPLSRRQLVLAALAAAGENATFTPAQVQKLFFLIGREASHLVGGPHFAFRPYDYGPFDSAVYVQLDILHREGFVSIVAGRYRLYMLTAAGFIEGQQILMTLPQSTRDFIQQTARWVRGLNFQQLVAAIYRRYPDMKANSIFQG
jgi:uncharacterized protein